MELLGNQRKCPADKRRPSNDGPADADRLHRKQLARLSELARSDRERDLAPRPKARSGASLIDITTNTATTGDTCIFQGTAEVMTS